MRQELVKLIPEAASNRRYVVRITSDGTEGKAQLSYFIDNDEPFPVIATTSKLLSTGVDATTCKLIVLDQTINSMTEFKQIVGRGTRIREDYKKLYFTIMDFKRATRLFLDPDFDGEPVTIFEPTGDESIVPPDEAPGVRGEEVFVTMRARLIFDEHPADRHQSHAAFVPVTRARHDGHFPPTAAVPRDRQSLPTARLGHDGFRRTPLASFTHGRPWVPGCRFGGGSYRLASL